MAREGEGHDLSEEVRRMVVTTMDEASMRGDAVEAHRASYDKTDEAAMLAVPSSKSKGTRTLTWKLTRERAKTT